MEIAGILDNVAKLYHGSRNLFDRFQVTARATVSHEVAPVPIFVTDQLGFARLHAVHRGFIYTLDADLGKTFDGSKLYTEDAKYWPPAESELTPEGAELWNDIFNGTVFPGEVNDESDADALLAAVLKHNWDAMEDPSFLRWLQTHGYDSFRIRGEHTGNHFGVFDPARLVIVDVAPVSEGALKSKLLR